MEFVLDLETMGGANAGDCCRVAVRVATTLGVAVRFSHNEVTVIASPGDDPERVYNEWRRGYAAQHGPPA